MSNSRPSGYFRISLTAALVALFSLTHMSEADAQLPEGFPPDVTIIYEEVSVRSLLFPESRSWWARRIRMELTKDSCRIMSFVSQTNKVVWHTDHENVFHEKVFNVSPDSVKEIYQGLLSIGFEGLAKKWTDSSRFGEIPEIENIPPGKENDLDWQSEVSMTGGPDHPPPAGGRLLRVSSGSNSLAALDGDLNEDDKNRFEQCVDRVAAFVLATMRAHFIETNDVQTGPVILTSEDSLYTREIVIPTFEKGRPSIRSCYDTEVKKSIFPFTETPLFSLGVLTVGVVVNELGKATSVKLEKNSTGNERLAKCISARIKKWRFPTAEGKKSETAFLYTWVFPEFLK